MTSTSAPSLQPLFAPTSVAVIGASASPGKLGNAAMRTLRRFPGEVFAVNPRADGPIEGRATVRTVKEIGRPVDLALFCVPPGNTHDAVSECVHANVASGVIFAGGMAESGPQGAELQRLTVEAAQSGGMRLLGPNTSGFLHPSAGVVMSFAPGVERIDPGPLAIVAQSGGVNLALAWAAHAQGLGVSLGVGLGNAADVDSVDVLDYLQSHEPTRAVLLHIEGTEDGRRLVDAVGALAVAKPVIVLKIGRSDVADFAASHTGALTGSWALARSALKQAGAVVVDDTMQMIAAAHALTQRRARPSHNPGVGIVTGQAGPGILVTDALRSAGVSVPELSPATVAAVGEILPPITYQLNPVDTARPSDRFGDVVRLVANDDGIDMVGVYAIYEPGAVDPDNLLADGDLEVPLVFMTAGPDPEVSTTAEGLRARGVAVLREPELGAQALTALAADARARARLAETGDASRESTPAPRVPAATIDEAGAKDLLDALGLSTPPRRVCSCRAQAHAALGELTAPIVVKVLHPSATHKTELGGVHLGVTDASTLDAALDAIDSIGLDGSCYLLEETAGKGVEILLGGTHDASFGPTVLVGIGGVGAEAIQDVAVRLAPLTVADAHEMLDELRAGSILDGHRGQPAVDRDELAAIIVSVGQLLVSNPHVREIDINPLRATATGLVALDALIVTEATSHLVGALS